MQQQGYEIDVCAWSVLAQYPLFTGGGGKGAWVLTKTTFDVDRWFMSSVLVIMVRVKASDACLCVCVV